MSHSDGQCVGSRLPTLPPVSTRTLLHPSFMPLCVDADCAHPDTRTVHPVIPAEFFYSDPTMSSGRRIPNAVSDLMVFKRFQLNTPQPVMSACVAPPTCSDPFRSGLHPTRDLGCLTVKTNAPDPLVQPRSIILQLTQEEDQAVTNLLKLHHQEPMTEQMDPSPISVPVDSTSSRAQLQEERSWSHMELEAANTLLSFFSPMEKGQTHNKSAATLPETFPASFTADCTQNHDDRIRRRAVEPGSAGLDFVAGRKDYLPVREEFFASSPPSVSKTTSGSGASPDSEVKERALSDSEEEAVFVLLSLGVLDAVQGLPQT